MATPTRKELEEWADNYVSLWNAGDKEAWVANWLKIAPGDCIMLDPVGTPEKRGFEECCAGPYDLFQPKLRFKMVEGARFICGNEVAWTLENHFTTDDGTSVLLSIETYRFQPDGSVVIRTYYDVPKSTDGELGQIFQEYLPEQG